MIFYYCYKLYQKIIFFIKRVIVILIYPLLHHFIDDRNLWLIGGSLGEYLDNNAFALFKEIRTKYNNIDIYYVINENSPDKLKISQSGPVLYKNSIKCNLYVLLSKVLVCTHSIDGDITLFGSIFLRSKMKVNLFHGIHALKKKNLNKIKKIKHYNIFIASGKRDKKIKHKIWGIEKNKIYITGLPQYDTIMQKKDRLDKYDKSQSILFFPTWRPWLLTRKEIVKGHKVFTESEFFRRIISFLSNESFLQILQKHQIKCNILIHKNLNIFYESFEKFIPLSKNLNLLEKNIDYQNVFLMNNILITDYSSIIWDYIFLNKKIILYQFDKHRFSQEQGSYLDIKSEINVPQFEKEVALIQKLEEIINMDVSLFSAKYKGISNDFFSYRDSNNSKRVINSILDNLN